MQGLHIIELSGIQERNLIASISIALLTKLPQTVMVVILQTLIQITWWSKCGWYTLIPVTTRADGAKCQYQDLSTYVTHLHILRDN